MPKWHYWGDVSLENGGFFYRTDQWDNLYADVVRVTPCSDAGLPDNQFWVEELVVEPSTQEKLQEALEMIEAWPLDDKSDDEIAHLSITACVIAGLVYRETSDRVVQIGGPDPFYNGRDRPLVPHVQLRASTDLKKWVRREYGLGRESRRPR